MFCVLNIMSILWVAVGSPPVVYSSNISIPKSIISPLLVTFKERQIYKLDISSQKETTLFKPHYEWFYRSHLYVSPNDTLFAFIGKDREKPGKPKLYLRVLDLHGELIHTIEDVQRYVWSPDGNKITYITYDLKDLDYPFRYPTGLWVLNLKTGEKKKIADRADEIYWASHDNNIYFIDYKKGRNFIYKWSLETREIEVTKHKDIYFSPDGKYYLRLYKDEAKPIQLYEANTDKELFTIKVRERLLREGDTTHLFPKDVGELWSSLDREPPHGWVFNQGHFLLFVKDVQNFVFDVETKKVIKEFDGKISSWICNGSRIVIERNGKMVLEKI